MKVIAKAGRDDLAVVYISETEDGKRIEFVESLEPSIPRERKWVNIVSTLFGCPVQCRICDAGQSYHGKLDADQILFQINYLVQTRYPSGIIPCEKWKIQFARMGEPSFNPAVLRVIETLPELYPAPGLMPSISTIAPQGTDSFFDNLLEIKKRLFPDRFQFQFSIHSTSTEIRRQLIPVNCWSFSEMAKYGENLFASGGRKITLNFTLIEQVRINPDILLNYFDPEVFLVKLTPLNPTCRVITNGLVPLSENDERWRRTFTDLESAGYKVIVSIGELDENAIGSNCGQYLGYYERASVVPDGSYSYSIRGSMIFAVDTPGCLRGRDVSGYSRKV